MRASAILARGLEASLFEAGHHGYVIDGDNVLRRGLNRDLGFSNADRVENICRVGELCRGLRDRGASPAHDGVQAVR